MGERPGEAGLVSLSRRGPSALWVMARVCWGLFKSAAPDMAIPICRSAVSPILGN